MPTSKEYYEYVFEQLSNIDGVRYRQMMGEYIIYYQGRIIGGIYDDRLLVKPTASAKKLMPEAPLVLPYEGAKQMLLVEDIDDKQFLSELFDAMVGGLPAPKKKS